MEYIIALLTSLLAITAVIAATLSWQRTRRLEDRLNSIMGGDTRASDIEKTLNHYYETVRENQASSERLQLQYHELAKVAAASLQKTAVVRFNPFKTTGGDQSFALAMLDNHDSGFLLTSIHSREGTRMYIKPVTYGNSDYTLSREEKSALYTAQGKTTAKTRKE